MAVSYELKTYPYKNYSTGETTEHRYYSVDYESTLEDLHAIKVLLEREEDAVLLDDLEAAAAGIAEDLEIQFIYTRADGEDRTYSPQAHWEASGGCEWEESAEYGYDYGWNI